MKYGEDYVTKDQTGAPSVDLDAPIVFVGYGIDAPEYQWNDYEGIDVKGKILLAIVNEPPSNDEHFFQGKALTYYGRWTYKFEEAARRGAAGVMVIHRTDLASYGWEVVRNSESTETSYLRNDPLSVLKAASWIQLDVARKLFAAAGMNADQMIEAAGKRGFKAVELPVRLKAHIVSQVRDYDSANVIAMVPGADSSPGGNVLYTAHYDHLGIDPTEPGDKIYNGAVDNATGCGILLEMVRAYATAKIPPPRNVYFASVTAEEQGLLGSKYLGMHPPEPIRRPHPGPQLRRAAAHRRAHFGAGAGFGAHQLLSRGGEDRGSLRSSDPAGRCADGGHLLPLRPLQPGPRRRAGILDRRRGSLRRPSGRMGKTAERGVRCPAIPPSHRRISCRYGFPRRCQIGAVRVLTRVAGFVVAPRDLEAGRRV